MKAAKKSSFRGLVNYILDAQSKTERVDLVRVTNCASDTPEIAALEVLGTQEQNKKATGDKTYHLLISFPVEDDPAPEVLREIESAFCDALGFSEHQRISAVHRDTDNVHIHVAINKIHPTRFTMHEPYNDYWVRDQLAADLEKKYGLTVTNHKHTKSVSQSKVSDMEAHSGEQSLAGWIREECLDAMYAAATWEEFHTILAENGLVVRLRGNGLVFESGNGVRVKGSTVDRALSKSALERRLGRLGQGEAGEARAQQPGQGEAGEARAQQPGQGEAGEARAQQLGQGERSYERRPVTTRIVNAGLYAAFQAERAEFQVLKGRRLRELTPEKQKRIELAKSKAALKRAAVKLGRGNLAKRIVYASINKTLRDEIASIVGDISQQRQNLRLQKPMVWADWLRSEAGRGNVAALEALRDRPNAVKKQAARHAVTDGVMAFKFDTSNLKADVDGITKSGSIIYRTSNGAVRDDGTQLAVTKRADEATLVFALSEAASRHGTILTLTGSQEFQTRAAEIAGRYNLPVSFKQSALENIRKNHLGKTQHDKSAFEQQQPGSPDRNGRIVRGDAGRGRSPGTTTSGRDARAAGYQSGPARAGTVVRTAADFRREVSKAQGANIAGLGLGTAPAQTNGMRNLSSIPMAFNAGRSQVLLPPDARNDLDAKRATRDTTLRWPADHGGYETSTISVQAAEKYIQERHDKRLAGLMIPAHALYDGQGGGMVFEGLRRIDNQALALFTKEPGGTVFVLPVDTKTASRLAHNKRGSSMTVDKAGRKILLVKKGRLR